MNLIPKELPLKEHSIDDSYVSFISSLYEKYLTDFVYEPNYSTPGMSFIKTIESTRPHLQVSYDDLKRGDTKEEELSEFEYSNIFASFRNQYQSLGLIPRNDKVILTRRFPNNRWLPNLKVAYSLRYSFKSIYLNSNTSRKFIFYNNHHILSMFSPSYTLDNNKINIIFKKDVSEFEYSSALDSLLELGFKNFPTGIEHLNTFRNETLFFRKLIFKIHLEPTPFNIRRVLERTCKYISTSKLFYAIKVNVIPYRINERGERLPTIILYPLPGRGLDALLNIHNLFLDEEGTNIPPRFNYKKSSLIFYNQMDGDFISDLIRFGYTSSELERIRTSQFVF